MAWSNHCRTNGTISASQLLSDIIAHCEMRLGMPQTPNSFRPTYLLIRSHAQLCTANQVHASHGQLILPDGSGAKGAADLDTAFNQVLACFNALQMPPSFAALMMALGEIDHSGGGTGGPRP